MDTASSVYPELSTTPTPTQHDHLLPRDQPYDSEVGEMVQGWSDATLMEAVQSGRYSAWSTEEGDFDRAATEKVERMFRCLNRALYDNTGSGFTQTDRECSEWAQTFPHFQVRGDHLYDVMDDGTERAEPIYREDSSTTITENQPQDTTTDSDGLAVVGRHIEPITLSDTPEEDALKEEILAQHGVLEEYIAFDCSADSQRRGKRKGLPSQSKVPSVPAEASVYQIVLSQLLDVVWSEVATILHPLVMAARERAMQVRSSGQSMQTSLATSHSSSPHESYLLLPGLPRPLPPSTARDSTHYNTQFYHDKPATSLLVAPPMLPPLAPPPPLSGLMMIKPVSLRHRNMSLLSQNEEEQDILNHLSLHHHHHPHNTTSHHNHTLDPTNTVLGFHTRHTRHNHHPALPPSPPGVGGLASYRHTLLSRAGLSTASRRPLQLKPIENPRTPAPEKMGRAQIRGVRFPVNASGAGLTPPPTAGGCVASGGIMGVVGSGHLRNNQLPPLETGLTDRSPPVVRGSKSTFSQRNTSAAAIELQELRKMQLPGTTRPLDLRPSTSSSNYRVESGKVLGGKKLSEPATRGGGGGMKMVRHATGVSYSSSGVTGVEGVGSGKMGLPYSIAEVEDEDSSRLNITGHSSAILKSKARSQTDNRAKHRGHGR